MAQIFFFGGGGGGLILIIGDFLYFAGTGAYDDMGRARRELIFAIVEDWFFLVGC